MADFLEEQKKQSLFQNMEKEKTQQGQVFEQKQTFAPQESAYVSQTEKAKDKAFYTTDERTEHLISKVRDKALTPSEQRDILEEDRKFRTKAGIRL